MFRIAIALITQAWLELSPAAAVWDKNCLNARKTRGTRWRDAQAEQSGLFWDITALVLQWLRCVYMCESVSLCNGPEHLVNISSVLFVSDSVSIYEYDEKKIHSTF